MGRLIVSDTAPSLEHQLQRLALEANFIQNLSEQFETVLPTLASKLSDHAMLFKARLFDKPAIKDLYVAYDASKSRLDHLVFANYKDTLVSIPEGFKGDFMEYLKVLTNLNAGIYKEANSLLSEYNSVLSDFITNKDAKLSNTSHDILYKKASQYREAMVKKINPFFTSGSQSKAKLSMMISRFSDVKPLTDLAVGLERLNQPQSLNQIADAVEKSIQLLGIIKDQLEKDQTTTVSGVTASSIANGAYELGQFIEFIAIFNYKCNQATTAVKNTLIRISELD